MMSIFKSYDQTLVEALADVTFVVFLHYHRPILMLD